MARRLAPDEIMQTGDILISKGEVYDIVQGYAGKPASAWEFMEGHWVEESPVRYTSRICADLIEGLSKIQEDLWREY